MDALNARYIPDQTRFLEAFLRRASHDRIPVIIVGGQYNPAAYTPSNLAMHYQIVSPLLFDLARRYSGVTVFDRSKTGEFSEADYRDGYHIKLDKGPPFVTHLLKLLSADKASRSPDRTADMLSQVNPR